MNTDGFIANYIDQYISETFPKGNQYKFLSKKSQNTKGYQDGHSLSSSRSFYVWWRAWARKLLRQS